MAGTTRKILVTMWECTRCQYANFRRTSDCRICGQVRAYGAQLVQQWWVAAALPAGWDQEPRRPLARRGGGGMAIGGGGLGGGGGGGGGRLDGPTGAGGSRPLVLRRGEVASVDRCPTISARQRDQQRQAGGLGGGGIAGTRNRWNAPPQSGPEDRRIGAPGILDNPRNHPRPGEATAAASGGGGGGDGWMHGLNKIQRKRIRQRARRKREANANGEGERSEDDEGSEEMEEDEDDVEEQRVQEPVRPYQPPPLPRLLCVQQAEQLRRRVEKMQQEGSRPQLLQRAEKRLEEARRMVRDAGGPTERRLVFSILQEETKERKLRDSLPKADKEVEEREAELRAAQQAVEDARRRRADLEVRWKNSKARVAFLAAEKAAETRQCLACYASPGATRVGLL